MQGKLNSVPVPPRIAQQPGHYSIVGLLPEDHTFSKGMLFLLEPGTKCVIFDVDGAPCPALHADLESANESCTSGMILAIYLPLKEIVPSVPSLLISITVGLARPSM